MKNKLASAALALLAPAAFAQSSVTIYGIVDAGGTVDRHGAGTGTTYSLQNGIMAGSRLGFRGVEDLGSGLKAIFNLEMAFDSSTGQLSSYIGQPRGTPGTGFNRRSFVGLQNQWGTIMLGRDYTPFFWSSFVTDNFNLGLFGSNLNQVALNGSNSETLHRVSNAIFYESPDIGGFIVRGDVSAPENAEGFAKAYGIGGDYRRGGLLLSAAYQRTRVLPAAPAGTKKTRSDFVGGGKYDFGAFSLGAGYAATDAPGPSNTISQYWFGGTYRFGVHSIVTQISRMHFDAPLAVNEGRATTFGLAYTYAFSRRTVGYLSYGQVTNTGNARLTLYGAAASVSAAAVGADPSGLGIGMRHTF